MTSFDKKPVKKVVAVTAVAGRRMESVNKKQARTEQNNNNSRQSQRNPVKVSLGLVVRLALKVAQQKLRHIARYFSELVASYICGFLQWSIVILSSMFFATKFICSRTEEAPQQKKDIKPEFLALFDDKEHLHHKFHVQHKLQIIEEEELGRDVPECDLPAVEPETAKTEPEEVDYYGIVPPEEKAEEEPRAQEISEERERARPRPRLVRRLSNVERFYLENPARTESQRVKNRTKVLLSIVYVSCAFVITQFYLLISALLSTTLPSGLVFLITSLVGVATIVVQMVFPGKKKPKKKQQQSPQPKTKECSVQTVNTIFLDAPEKLKPVQAVRPFILRRLSSKEIWNICRTQEKVEKPQGKGE